MDGGICFFLSGEESAKGGVGALQVVEPAAGDELPGRAPDAGLFPVVEEEVVPQDLGFIYVGGLCHGFHERVFAGQSAVEGQQIFLHIIFIAVVGLPVHVDGQARDQQEVPADIDEFCVKCIVSRIFDDDAACDGERSVEPGRAEHAAVALGIEPDVMSVRLQLRVLLDLE